MAQPLTVALPPGLHLWDSCAVAVTALDPATGAPVSGVNVSNVTLEVELDPDVTGELDFGPFMLVTGPEG